MNEDVFRMLMMVSIFNLPTVVIVIVLAWAASALFPKPKPKLKHALFAFIFTWIATTIVVPFTSATPGDHMDNGLYTTATIAAVLGLLLLYFSPRIWSRSA